MSDKIIGFWQIAGTYGAKYSKIHIYDRATNRTKCGITPEPEYCSKVTEVLFTYRDAKYCKRCFGGLHETNIQV